MNIRVAGVVTAVAACLAGLAGCSSPAKLSDLWAPKAGSTASAPAGSGATGSLSRQPGASAPHSGAADSQAKAGLLGSEPDDDLALGKKYFRARDFGLAEQRFQRAVELHPGDAEAWVDLAASYDRLRRFDLADRAYAEAIRLVGPRVEILNDQGFSYMLRGEYKRAYRKLEQAARKDPANPYVQANLQLLEQARYSHKAIE